MNKINITIAIIILGVAIAVSYYFVTNPAHIEKKAYIAANAINVKIAPLSIGTYPIKIEVMGKVTPALSANLKAQVQGEIIHVDSEFISGGFFKENDEILQIEPYDYELAVKLEKSALKQASAALKLELGQQEIAKDELKIIEQSTGRKLKSNDLALRKPQLEQARANVDSANARLKQAELNLERTKITAPFNGIITERNTNLGNVITTRDIIASFVSTDEYWVKIEIAVHDMKWLKIGSKSLITLNNKMGERKGVILRQTGSLNKSSRLASMIISVKDPLSGNAPLILGDYVHVTLYGQDLKNAARVPVEYLRAQNKLWLEIDGKLAIKQVSIAYKDRKFAYITKKDNNWLNQGGNIITSNIITPVDGMDIKIQNNKVQNNKVQNNE